MSWESHSSEAVPSRGPCLPRIGPIRSSEWSDNRDGGGGRAARPGRPPRRGRGLKPVSMRLTGMINRRSPLRGGVD